MIASATRYPVLRSKIFIVRRTEGTTTFVYNPVSPSESSGCDKKSSRMTEKIVVFSNCGSEEEARRIARALVEARVAPV